MIGELKISSPMLVLMLLCFGLASIALSVTTGIVESKRQLPWSYQAGGIIYSIAISSDGNYIVAGTSAGDSKIYLFSQSDNTPLWSYYTGGAVFSVDISSDGSYIVAGAGGNNKVFLFSRLDNIPLWSYETGKRFRSVAISSDGSYIVAGSEDHKVYLFSRSDNNPLWSYQTDGAVLSVAISSEGNYVAVGGQNMTYLFSRTSGTPLRSYATSGHVSISSDGNYITSGGHLFSRVDNASLLFAGSWATVSSDGNYIVGGGYVQGDYHIHLFSRSSPSAPLWSYQTDGYVHSAAISSDGNYILVGEGNKVSLFSYLDNIPLWSYPIGDSVYSVAISSDGSYVVAGGYGGRIYLFSRELVVPPLVDFTYFPSNPLITDNIQFTDASVDPGGKIVSWYWDFGDGATSTYQNPNYWYSSAGTYTVKLTVTDNDGMTSSFSRSITVVNQQQPLWSYQTGGTVHAVAVSSDGSYVGAGSGDHKIYLFSSLDNVPLWSYHTGGSVFSVAISSDGKYVVAGSEDGKVYLLSRSDNTLLWSYQTGGRVRSVGISSDGKHIVAESNGGKVYLFSNHDNAPIWSYQAAGEVDSVSISSNGSYIVAGGPESLYFFSRTSSTPLWVYTADISVGSFRSISVSSDGSLIVAGTSWYPVGELITNGGWIFLFSRTSSTPLWRSRVGDWICPIAISLDGNYIAGGGNYYIGNRIVYLFSGDNDMPLWSHQTSGFVRSVAISSDGSHIAAGSTEREVYLFSRASGTPLWGYQTGGSIFFVAISSDGGYVVTGDSDHKIHFFSENILTSFKVTIAFIKPDGTPLTNTVIYYGALPEMKTRLLGTTDSQGKITSTNPALAGRTIYFKSSDGRYVGSISVGATAGEVTAELTEVSKFPILWVVTTIAMVAAAIGAVTLIKKRKYHGTQII